MMDDTPYYEGYTPIRKDGRIVAHVKVIEASDETDKPMAVEKRSLAVEYTHRLNLYQTSYLLEMVNNDEYKEECAKIVSKVLEYMGFNEQIVIGEDGRARCVR